MIGRINKRKAASASFARAQLRVPLNYCATLEAQFSDCSKVIEMKPCLNYMTK